MMLQIFTIKLQNLQSFPKVNSNHTSLAVISLDYVLKKDENCWLQIF